MYVHWSYAMKKAKCQVLGACLLAFSMAYADLENPGFEVVGKDGFPIGWSRHPDWHGERIGHNGSGGLVFERSGTMPITAGRPQQRVVLKVGKRYRFSALVKTENLVTERESGGLGVTLLVEGYGADGKWRSGSAARPRIRGTSGDWVKIEGITKVVPPDVSYGILQPWAVGCVSGRAVFDNICFTEYDIPPVEGVFPHTYRNESSGGMVTFSASINADIQACRLEDYSASFTYTAVGGRRVTVPGAIVSAVESRVVIETTGFPIGTNNVTCTLLRDGRPLGSASVAFVRRERPTRRKVYIDSHGRTIVDGKPFFPLGMYFDNRHATESNITMYAKSPFNCLMPYAGRGSSMADMDRYGKAGLKVIFDLRRGISKGEEMKSWVYDKIMEFKNHPALLAWYTNDEHPVMDIPKLKMRQKWVEEFDPDHPTWSVQDVFSEVRHYLGTYDVLGMDPYPIPTKPIGTMISSMRQGVSGTFGTRAVWQVPQAFGWGWFKRRETKGQRAPTQKEMANMTWQAIAGGANGIIYYAYHHLSEPHEDPNDDFEHAWARTKAAAAEVKKYEDILLSAGPPIGVSGMTEDVAARTWRAGSEAYLLVVNCTTNAQSVVLALSERTGMPSAVDLGPGPVVDDGKLHFNLAPIDYTMIRLPITF